MLKVFRKISFVSILWTFYYFFIFCLLLKSGFSYLDPDLGWHLRVGEEIAKTYKVPTQNIYNYTYTGDWVDHEWLSNYLIYQIYNNLGYPALVIVFALIIILVLILLNLALTYLWREKGRSPPIVLIIILQLFGVIAAMPHFGVRIQELALLFLCLIYGIIYIYEKNSNWRYLLLFVPLFYLWSCLHASFLIGFFIIFSWLAVKLLEKIIIQSSFKNRFEKYVNFGRVLSRRDILIYIFIALSAFFATLLTPYYLKLYSFLAGYGNSFYLSNIQEWLSQFVFPFVYWQLLYLCLAGLALFIYIYYSKKEKIYLWTLFIFLVFFILSFKSRRHFPLFFVSSFILLITVFNNQLKAEFSKFINLKIWLKIFLIFCFFLSSLSLLLSTNFINNPFGADAFAEDYPHDALIYIVSHPEYDNYRIFNEYGWGGYMIYTNPDKKIFIDGRLPQVIYNDQSFLEEYYEFYRIETPISEKFQEYDIRLVLMRVKDRELKAKKWEKFIFRIQDNELKQENHLREYLKSSPDWQAIYSDQSAIVYLRK
jgi:hypothetical protein